MFVDDGAITYFIPDSRQAFRAVAFITRLLPTGGVRTTNSTNRDCPITPFSVYEGDSPVRGAQSRGLHRNCTRYIQWIPYIC